MFGIIRPCRNRLSAGLHTEWVAHLCGLCLALRDEHGQFARTVTNYDGLVISALVEAQTAQAPNRAEAGPCPLRGMRRAKVAEGAGARLAASVSLVLASAKLRDHAEDKDGMFKRAPISGLARKAAQRWEAQGNASGTHLGFNTSVLTRAVDQQVDVERGLSPGDSVLLATAPTEDATSAAFAHTAVLAGRPANSAPLAEAGKLFGRIAHLLDAVEDLEEDQATGAWNPLSATETDLAEARRLCDDAVYGVRLALRETEFTNSRLIHALLVHELQHAVHRTFGQGNAGYPPGHHQHIPVPAWQPDAWGPTGPEGPPPEQPPDTPPPEPPDESGNSGKPRDGDGGGCWVPKFRVPPRQRNFAFGCLVATYMCGSCQFCCRDPHPGPWSGKPREAWCDDCSCESCDCCDCCSCDCSC